MTEVQKLTNRLKQAWSRTNNLNYDEVECVLKSAKKHIDNGDFDSDLIDAYIIISEAFNDEFGVKNG